MKTVSIISKRRGWRNTIFSDETAVLSCSIFSWKTILCKTLIALAKTGVSGGILPEIFQWKCNF